ncbi:MAG: Vitamin B12 dependent methionine synthase activation subunit [Lachnospiraceae bacterium]|nr:Vitamin B12 dependent methionine synthase activation subunit [Lachnospiraceae bacterium]
MNIINYTDGKKLNIDRKETFRYLGYHFGGSVPDDPELDKMVTELEKKLKEAVTPRSAYEIYGLEVKDDSCILRSDKQVLTIKSARLSAHIRGCRNAILFAATLGPGADMLIRRYSGRSTIKPAILQAVGAAAIEAFADEVTDIIRFSPDTANLKMRFSPGYGDFSLEYQNDFFSLLSLEKNLGMSLNSALLMSPSKSITAVIGVI